MTTVVESPDEARRHELAAFLRSRRDRLAPEAVGLPVIGRRRAPGLRREEVAQLAGVGVTWYTWLEQGRPINVSIQVFTAIARALRLSPEETDHLFTLAGISAPAAMPESEVTAASLATIMESLEPLPAYVVSARYDIQTWNSTSPKLFGDYTLLPEHRKNIVWLMFTEPAWNEMIGGPASESVAQCVARFRRAFAGHVGEPEWQELVNELLDRSELFRRLWARHEIASTPVHKVKNFDHPLLGKFKLTGTSLWLADDPGSRLVVYTPIDCAGREVIDSLPGREAWIPWTDASL